MARISKKRKRKNKHRKLFTFIIILGLIAGACGAYGLNLLGKMDTTKIAESDEELGISGNDKNSKITNILLFGLDRRETSGNTRSDTIMIASVDREHKKIKLTSLMRDTYVDMPGRGMDKLGHAYAFGGPELAIRTINQNFDMNIRDFVTVDFFGLEKIVDTLGGVEIEVADNEVNAINDSIREMDKITQEDTPKVSHAGLQTLNGRQAVAYSRIRKVGNSDYQRTERQREVLEVILNKAMNAGVSQYPKMLNTMLPYVETSLSTTEIIGMGTSTVTSGIRNIDQYRVPVDGYLKGQTINGVSYVVPTTLEENVDLLHQFIYEDVKVTKREN